jgi:purine nucleoside permease
VSTVLALLAMALPTSAAVRLLMHPDVRAWRAYRRSIAAQRRCCNGQCTTADLARIPRQRTPKEF